MSLTVSLLRRLGRRRIVSTIDCVSRGRTVPAAAVAVRQTREFFGPWTNRLVPIGVARRMEYDPTRNPDENGACTTVADQSDRRLRRLRCVKPERRKHLVHAGSRSREFLIPDKEPADGHGYSSILPVAQHAGDVGRQA